MTATLNKAMTGVQKISLSALKKEKLSDYSNRQTVYGEKGTLSQLFARAGLFAERHSHPSEEFSLVTSGALKFVFDDGEFIASAGEVVVIAPNVPHTVFALEDSAFIDFFAPPRADWVRGEDQYLRR